MSIPNFLIHSRKEQKTILESLIFASEDVLNSKSIINILNDESGEKKVSLFQNTNEPENIGIGDIDFENVEIHSNQEAPIVIKLDEAYLNELVYEINQDLAQTGRPFHIVNFAGGYQFATRGEYGEYVSRLIKSKSKRRFSQATLETLAIVAYKQPISKPQIDQIRGVNSSEIIKSLMEKNIVRVTGRSESLGKPLLYGTTDEFLKIFGLYSLSDLPKLKEIDEISKFEMDDNQENQIVINVSQEDVEMLQKYDFELEQISDEELEKLL